MKNSKYLEIQLRNGENPFKQGLLELLWLALTDGGLTETPKMWI